MNSNKDIDRFTEKDNALILNSILQMLAVALISAPFMLFDNFFVWSCAAFSCCISLAINILCVASYENDCEHYGNAMNVMALYDDLAKACCFSLFFMLTAYFMVMANLHTIRVIPGGVILGLIACYVKMYMERRHKKVQ